MWKEIKDRFWLFDSPVWTEVPYLTMDEKRAANDFEKFLSDNDIPYKVELESYKYIDDLKVYECTPKSRDDFLKLVHGFDGLYFYQ